MTALPPIAETFFQLVDFCKHEIVLCAPFVQTEIIELIAERLGTACRKRTLITSGEPDDLLSGANDLGAVYTAIEQGFECYLLRNLHAKLYVVDQSSALITSANLSRKALFQNAEIGWNIDSQQDCRMLNEWLENIRNDSRQANRGLLDRIDKWIHSYKKIDSATAEPRQYSQDIDIPYFKSRTFQPIQEMRHEVSGRRRLDTGRRMAITPDVFKQIEKRKNVFQGGDPSKAEELDTVWPLILKGLKRMPSETIQGAVFGLSRYSCSLVTGNIWLVGHAFKKMDVVDVIVDTPVLMSGLIETYPAKSTKRYIQLWWAKIPLERVGHAVEAEELWESYERACIKILDSPISQIQIHHQKPGKLKLTPNG